MADNKSMTAPIAIIKVNGQPVGFMKNIRVTESIRRGVVKGIGTLLPQELPALDWTGQFNCSFYMISLDVTGIPKALIRNVPTVQAWIDNVLLGEQSVDIAIFKKIPNNFDPTTCLTDSTLKPFATIRGCFIDRDGFDISESQISGRDQDFQYMTPILFSL